MSLWILDTDHVSLFLDGNVAICQRVIANSANLAVSVVTVQEVFNGWIVRINSPAEINNLVYLYTRLCVAIDFLKSVRIINFDQTAQERYAKLLQENPRLTKHRLQKDMRIAAIALANGATVVTRNSRDFSLVSDLAIDNWS